MTVELGGSLLVHVAFPAVARPTALAMASGHQKSSSQGQDEARSSSNPPMDPAMKRTVTPSSPSKGTWAGIAPGSEQFVAFKLLRRTVQSALELPL